MDERLFHYWIVCSILSVLCLIVLLQRPWIRAVTVLSTYWFLMIFLGGPLYAVTQEAYVLDPSLAPQAVLLVTAGFVIFTAGCLVARFGLFRMRMSFPQPQRVASVKLRCQNQILLWVSCLISVSFLGMTFYRVGYIPLLQDLKIAKYFQDQTEAYVSVRPLYTLALAVLSSQLAFMLPAVFVVRRKTSLIMLILISLTALVLTGKRGPLLMPFAYAILVYVWYTGRQIRGATIFIVLVAVSVALSHRLLEDQGVGHLSRLLGFSYFVNIRELTRLLTFYDGEHLYGLTYLGGLTSFFPTAISDFKATYLYGRYIMTMVGQDPDLAGAMRTSYVGELLINFGYAGILYGSLIFGFVAECLDRLLLWSNLISRYGLGAMVYYVMIAHTMIIFFEDGSSVILHGTLRLGSYYVFMRCCLKAVGVEARSAATTPHTRGDAPPPGSRGGTALGSV